MHPPEQKCPPESCDAACLVADAIIQNVEKLLLEPRPDILERCERELREVIVILEGLLSADKREFTLDAGDAVRRIKRTTGRLHQQVEHASNLWAGWLQLRLGTGYTQRGRPVFGSQEPGSTFEA